MWFSSPLALQYQDTYLDGVLKVCAKFGEKGILPSITGHRLLVLIICIVVLFTVTLTM